MEDDKKDGTICEAEKNNCTDYEPDLLDLLGRSWAFFVNSNIPEETKDNYFLEIMRAYLACKDEAKKDKQTKAQK